MSLRAVYDDGKKQSQGRVRGMWSSGIVLETDVQAGIGSPIALVILSGGFDGTRLAAEVAGVEKNALLLNLPGLDGARWTRLQALVEGKPSTVPLPITPPARVPPPNVPVFIISGGDEDDFGDPTGVVNLGPGQRKKAAVPAPSPFDIPIDPFARQHTSPKMVLPKMAPVAAKAGTASLERQLKDASDENAKLKREVQRLTGLKSAIEDELKDALAKLDAIETLVKR